MQTSSIVRFNSCPHAANITLQQIGAKFITRLRRFRRHIRPDLDELEVNSTGEILVGQIACHKCPMCTHDNKSWKKPYLGLQPQHNSIPLGHPDFRRYQSHHRHVREPVRLQHRGCTNQGIGDTCGASNIKNRLYLKGFSDRRSKLLLAEEPTRHDLGEQR